MRQTHHWAADVFMASIVVHLMRVFFTGAYRRPRELTWLVGLTLLFTALLEGYLGYSLVDDLLSGMGLADRLRRGPVDPPHRRPRHALVSSRRAVPGGTAQFWSRMYIVHVLLIPLLLATLIGVHLALVAARHHTQFRESPRTHRSAALSASRCSPAQIPRSLGLMFFVVAILFLLGGLVQINPIWQWGPFEPWLATNGAQPDWYLGWLIGALRLMPSFDVTIGHFTVIPNPFWGGVLFPLVVVGVLAGFPWIQRRLTGDNNVHNLADRPRDAPNRTAFGVAFLSWVFLIFVFGAADRIFVLIGLSYDTQLSLFRIGIWILPIVLFFLTRRICRELLAAEAVDAVRRDAEKEGEAHERSLAPQGR